jgi:hypothetical protein
MSLTDPRTILLAIFAVTAAALLIRTRGRLARQTQQWEAEYPPAGEYGKPHDSASLANSLPNDLARWEVEMHETTRQLSAQLDAKLGLLQSLIADAQRAAARLEVALDHAHPMLPPGSQAESLLPAVGQGRDLPRHESTLRKLAASIAESSPSVVDDEPPAGGWAYRREEVYRLADYGFAAPEIARRVGSPLGEVELMLSLRAK